MASSDDDEDLKRAIALSLGKNPTPIREVVNLISDSDETEDEDEDLKRAMALSLGETYMKVTDAQRIPDHAGEGSSSSAPASLPIAAKPAANVPAPGPSGVLGLDRKAMEEERLARLGKRKRNLSPERPKKQATKAPASPMSQTTVSNPVSTPSSSLQYPAGAIKRTCATKYPRTDDIAFSEVLQAPSVHTAVLSAFQWEYPWLVEKLNPLTTKQIWIMNAKGSDVQERWRREMRDCGIPNMQLHFPPMDGSISSMHAKFMLLFGKEKLRFVVQSANMERIHWGEVANSWQPGVMENTVFLIDLPRKAGGDDGKVEELPCFGKELVYFLEQQRVPRKVIDGVLKFDFAATNHLGFVHSMQVLPLVSSICTNRMQWRCPYYAYSPAYGAARPGEGCTEPRSRQC
jgi:hypothetical protein